MRHGPRHPCRSRLSTLEQELKEKVGDQSAELERVERRLADTTEALQSQKNLRMKEMLKNQVKMGNSGLIPQKQTLFLPLLAPSTCFRFRVAWYRLVGSGAPMF